MCELGCGNRAESFGHRVRKGQGGSWSPVNAVHLCGDGTRGEHGLLTSYPTLARAGGWEVDADADPETVPVWLVTPEGASWWLLTHDEHGHIRTWVDPDDYGLPERPVMPREFVTHARAARVARAAEDDAALAAIHDAQAATMAVAL